MVTSRLFDIGGQWEVVRRSDPYVRRLADRHYPRRRVGWPRVGGPGRVLVLRSTDRQAAWLSHYSTHPDDGLDVYRCAMFRNEGPVLSSELIVEAVELTLDLWGPPPPDGWATYVDTAKVRSSNPGFCFLVAGWTRDPTYVPDRRRRTLVRLRHP